MRCRGRAYGDEGWALWSRVSHDRPRISIELMAGYRQVGGRLGAYIRANDPSPQQLHAFLGDVLANDELLQPMRDVVSRTSFGGLKALAGSGAGSIQRDVLLQDLARRYISVVVDNIALVIDGMLGLPAVNTSFQQGCVASDNSLGAEEEGRQVAREVSDDPWGVNEVMPALDREYGASISGLPRADQRQLNASEICDENLWNPARDPEIDKRFLKAWSIRWFNKRYRPRLEKD